MADVFSVVISVYKGVNFLNYEVKKFNINAGKGLRKCPS